MRKSAVILGGFIGLAVTVLVKALRERAAPAPEPHRESPTALAAEALRLGIRPVRRSRAEAVAIPHEDDILSAGDPEVDPLSAAYVGDEVPGGDMPTPDQDGVDAIGRAYGLAGLDEPELHASAEILERRDRRRRS
jgi:hypothetical protein